jgi:adenylate cyclase class IV
LPDVISLKARSNRAPADAANRKVSGEATAAELQRKQEEDENKKDVYFICPQTMLIFRKLGSLGVFFMWILRVYWRKVSHRTGEATAAELQRKQEEDENKKDVYFMMALMGVIVVVRNAV